MRRLNYFWLAACLPVLFLAPGLLAQPPQGRRPLPGNRPPLGAPGGVFCRVPSAAAGAEGIALRLYLPPRARFAEGAPVMINVPGGTQTGSAGGRPEYAGLGFIEIHFAFPGGGEGEARSGGVYDFRGPNCLRALADVIRFASGRLANADGKKIGELAAGMKPLAANVGLAGSSHGGNAAGMVMATHGEEFPGLAFYASMESPYGIGNVNIELGGRDQGVNPAYNPQTGELDLTRLAWSAELSPGPPRRWQTGGPGLKGAFYFDLNGDGRYTEKEDFPANTFIQDLGSGPQAWYSPRLIAEAERRKLFATRPAHIPTLAESSEYWRWRDAAGSIGEAVRNCPAVAVIVYANARDHVQVAPDHPHILTQVEGFRQAGAKFVRLNPDRSYVERILRGGPGEGRNIPGFPDNDAGKTWSRGNIREGVEPDAFPMGPYMQAAVCELADRVQAGNWAKNLDAVLYPDAPWAAMGPRPQGGLPKALRPPKKR